MTKVGIIGRQFFLNDTVANPGTRAEGTLMNARMIQAAIDDYNTNTRKVWAYPDSTWSADRNLSEFIAQLPTYRSSGLNMVTVGMQGGHPRFQCTGENVGGWNFSMFTADGTLRTDAAARLTQVIQAADAAGIVVNVQFFYQNQDNRLSGNTAVIKATEQATTFLRDLGAQNVLVEIANEVSTRNYKHSALQPSGIDDRIDQVHGIWPEALVSVSFTGTYPAAVAQRVDWSSIHANSINASELRTKAQRYLQIGKPVLVTEDKWDNQASFDVALDLGVGWGFYEQGCEYVGTYRPGSASRYRDGFQSPPINWSINTSGKTAFFNAVSAAT